MTDPEGSQRSESEVAAAAALARMRAAARAKGFRPGKAPKRRLKDLPDAAKVAAQGSPTGSGRDPRVIGEELEAFVAGRGWQTDIAVGAVIGRWPEIVGPEISMHCAPVEFVEGVLTVRADSTAWATQLRLLSSSLLGRLAGEVGEGTVRELRIVGPSAPSWSRGARKASHGRGPRDTYG